MTISTLEERRLAASQAGRRTAKRHPALWLLIGLGVAIVAIMATVVWFVPAPSLREVGAWFDPMFFQYNILLLVVFVSMVPAITLVYVDIMKRERVARLKTDLDTEWAKHETNISESINIQFGPLNYVGSTVTLTVIIALFLAVMLLLKPVPAGEPGSGVSYAKGANLLLLGPYIEKVSATDEPTKARTYHRIILSLTAFQFGFLGAYVFFIGHLLRSYFTLDLSPNTFISISGRMVISSVTALVLSFPLQQMDAFKGRAEEYFIAFLPMLAFFIGFFPSSGLLIIEKAASKVFRVAVQQYSATSLARLSGMSLEHETRLRREGFDNIENLADADPIGLAVRTGFGYRQLRDWIGEAWLRTHLRGDYDAFVRATGIATRDELRRVLRAGSSGDPHAIVASAIPAALGTKIRIIGRLLDERETRDR